MILIIYEVSFAHYFALKSLLRRTRGILYVLQVVVSTILSWTASFEKDICWWYNAYQDNGSRQNLGIVQAWIIWNCPYLMKLPAMSPDINCIKNLWAILDVKVRQDQFSNKNVLKPALKELFLRLWNRYLDQNVSRTKF